MSDSATTEDRQHAFIGFIIKHIALNCLNLQPIVPNNNFSEVKLIGVEFINTLLEDYEDISPEELFNRLHEFNVQSKPYYVPEAHRDIYEANSEISDSFRMLLLTILENQKVMLSDPGNNLFNGLISELDRTCKSYGYEPKDTMLFSVLVALERYYGYFRLQYTQGVDQHEIIDSEKVNSIVIPYIDRLQALVNEPGLNYDAFVGLLWELIQGWREYFIVYGQLPEDISRKPVKLPEESKKKLSEVFSKAIQKEIKT